MNTYKEIVAKHNTGKKLNYLFFWGHQPSANGEITKSCFSQWWQEDFIVNNSVYPTTEHWMMAEKARLFNDKEIEVKILQSQSPGEAKKLGRKVKNFNQEIWEKNRFNIVEEGNFHKFSQNSHLKQFLLNTGDQILVEASPVDNIWGIGLPANHKFAKVPTQWRGLNLLGFVLMRVRERLLEE